MAGIIVELILIVLVFCAALWADAFWPYVVFPAYLGVLSLKITPVGKKIKASRLLLFLLAIGLGIALAVAYWVFNPMTEWAAVNQDNNLIRFFFGPQVLRLLWSAILGLLVAFDLLALILLPLAYFSAQGKYGDFEIFHKHKQLATRTVLFGMLGLSQGRISVREGLAQTDRVADNGLMLFGGPGELMVQEGNAVILERDGRVSRVVASGPTFLRSFERLSMVVPLQTRAERIFVEQLVTSEGLVIDQLEIWVFHTVALGPVEERTQDGQFEYNESILRTKIWSPSATDWRETIRGVTARMAHKIVPRYTLQDIMRPGSNYDELASVEHQRYLNTNEEPAPSSPAGDNEVMSTITRRQLLVEELKTAVSEITVRIGVAIRGLDLGAIRVSSQVRARLEEAPLATMARLAAEENAAAFRTQENARAAAQSTMIRALREAWDGGPPRDMTIKDLVIAIRYIEALEKMASEPSTKVILPMDSRLLSNLFGSIGT